MPSDWIETAEQIINDPTKSLLERPEWIQKPGKPRSLRIHPVGITHALEGVVDLLLVGQGNRWEEFSILLLARPNVIITRLCARYDDHDTTGWHGLSLPGDETSKEIHEPDPALTSLRRRDGLRVFCQRLLIQLPPSDKLPFGEDDQ